MLAFPSPHPPGLWVVRDLQLLHKAWRGPGEVVRTLQSQGNSPPKPSPFSSRKKKLLTTRTGWSCQKDGYHCGDPAPPGDSQLPPLPWTLLCPQVRERCLGLCGGEEEGQPPGVPPSGDPPQDLGSFLHWAVCLRSAYGGLAVSLPAPVPLLSSHLSVLLPESDFLCLLPPAPICVSQPQPLALSLWASVSVPNLCLWMCLAVSTCPSAFVQELACASPCPPFLSLSPLTAQLPITPSHSPCLSIPSCFLSLCCFFCLLVSI